MIKSFTLAIGLLFSMLSFGQQYSWSESSEPQGVDRQIVPSKYRTLSIDFQNLKSTLLEAPNEKDVSAADSPFLIELPHPDGGSLLFSIVESSVMAPELQAKFPDIRTFVGQGRGDYGHAIVRMDFSPKGFHAQILMAESSYYIDPFAPGLVDVYICYTREAFYENNPKQMPDCNPQKPNQEDPKGNGGGGIKDGEGKNTSPGFQLKTTNGTTLRTYDLALACTGEYAQYHGGTVSGAMAAMVTTMNRVNGVFERDMALRMIMVGNNDQLIFLNPSNDPYANTSGDLNANQNTCDNIIGSSNYDIGHLFGTGGGGIAQLFSPCTSSKARGLTGQGNPVGDPFDIDYVAHEMGHQWGANHTQNNNCNRSTNAAYEPGSASTIMGYAGICPPNLQSNSDDHFHNHSFNEMYNFSVTGFGNSCASPSATGNTPPSVTIPTGGFSIPISTPFELTASASDVNGDLLTYCWEQYDLGPSTASGDGDLTNPSGTAPIFRSWSPTTDDTRVFPRIDDLVNNTTVIGEHLPTYTRDLTFRCTVRDNRAGGGGVTDEEIAFEATNNAGPFLVTAPNTATTLSGGTTTTVTWDVANTNNSPVNCSNVDIFLSLDGGFTYPEILATNVSNNGSATVTVPNINTSQARVKVKAANNIFFDISNQDFTITSGCAGIPIISNVSPTTYNCSGGETMIISGSNFCDPVSVTVDGNNAAISNSSETQITVTMPGGAGTVDVVVTSSFGSSTASQVSYAAPLIASVAPTTLSCAGGATLTITGSNFCSATSVTVGGTSASNLIEVSSTEIQVTAPAGSGTNVPVQVTTPSGTSNSVNVDYAVPVIASVAPTSLDCAGGASLTITGSNFCDATSVTVGGSGAPILASSATQIVATVPPASGTNVPVQVTTPSGTSNSVNVDYAAPLIASVAPTSLDYAGGASLTITGSNFCDATSVTVGGSGAPILASSATQIVATVPPGSGTNVPVQVTTPSGTSNSVNVDYAAPLISSVSPSDIPCAGGTSVTIVGTNFCDVEDVTIGDVSAVDFTLVSSTEIEVLVGGGFGTQAVVVVTPSGSSNSVNITYTQAGCTDPNACNYDPAALCDDGSCISPPCDPVCDIELTASATPADPGFANGTSSVVATGGEEPYLYQWDDSFLQTTATAVGLFPGTYTCTVSDAENCTEEISIEVPLFTGIPLTQVSSPYCNTGGYALSDFIACNAVQNADAYRWELVVQGGNALPEYTRFNNKYLRIQWVNGTQPGVIYEVRVKARVSGEWGDYGQMCTIATSPNIPTTELRPEYHPTNNSGQNYAICDFAIAYGVANATDYRWRFDPDTDSNNGNEIIYTRGTGNPATRLSWVNGLAPGNTYFVAVSAEIGGTWGDYGVVHSIDLNTPTEPVIRPTFCNQTIAPNGYVLSTSVCAADYYQFQFEPVGGGQLSTRTSGNYVCFLSGVNPSLAPGDYNLRVRVSQGGVIGAYGAPCVITIADLQNPFGIAELKSGSSKAGASVFPNPSDGSNINIQLDLDSDGSHMVFLKLFNAYGQQIGFNQFSIEGKHFSGQIAQSIPLDNGLYFVEVISDNNRVALVKMVVQ